MKASWWSHSLERVRRGLSILWEGSRVGMGEGGGFNVCADPEYVLSHNPLF